MENFRRLFILLIILYASPILSTASTLPADESQISHILKRLDKEIDNRESYIESRQKSIDSLHSRLKDSPDNLVDIEQLAQLYTSFDNDSALAIYDRGYRTATALGIDSIACRFRISRASLLPLAGFMAAAEEEYRSINPDSLSTVDRIHYYINGRQMYSFISSYFHRFPEQMFHYQSLALEAQKKLLEILPQKSPDRLLNQGEYYFLTGEYTLAEATLRELLDEIDETDNRYARANHILADIARVRNHPDDVVCFLTLSAISDIKGATREVTSLQELGQLMFERNDIDRAHAYLYTALRNAVECRAETRMIQVAEAMPLIESVHLTELRSSSRRIYIVIALMAIIMILLIVALVLLRKKIRQTRLLQLHAQQANATKEVYISQFLNLCSIYMDKLKQFCNIANRKISTGKVEDLYQLTKSGKFIENQSKEFYEIFDNAFIHIYPGFVDSVNSLLRPDGKITLAPGELLNTDLRILAFMRLGITDSGRIAQILNYSVNTIYAYRNKLRTRAINRETFESDIMSI